MATDSKVKTRSGKYAQLKRQIGKHGVQKGVETLAQKRVQRHQKMTHSEAQAYIRARTAEGRSVGGFTAPGRGKGKNAHGKGAKPNAATTGVAVPDNKTRAAMLKRKAEQKGNITNKRPRSNPVGPRNESQPQGSRIAPEDVGARTGHTVGDINISVHVPPPNPVSTPGARPGSRPGTLAGSGTVSTTRSSPSSAANRTPVKGSTSSPAAEARRKRAAEQSGNITNTRPSAYAPSKPAGKGSVPSVGGNANVGGYQQPGPIRRGTTGPLPGPVAHTTYTRPSTGGKGKSKPISGGGGRQRVL
jgi:hypothetical protein